MQNKPALSLRQTLIERLLPPLLLLLLAGAFAAYWVAWRSATKAYDRSLLDTAFAISEQIQLIQGHPQLSLTPQARTVLLTDKFDRIFFSVRTQDGSLLLDGNPELPLPPVESSRTLGNEGRYYYDGFLRGEPVRLAALQKNAGGQMLTIVAAETLRKRNELVRDILLGMLLPELLLVVVSASAIWFGVRSGLRPLNDLQRELAGRSPSDLRTVAVNVPEEIQPVVEEINGLLRRLEQALVSQRNFVSDAAHQLRTPIAALQAQVEAVVTEAGAEKRVRLAGILSATQRLSHLVSQLLVLARAEPGLAEAQPVIDLADMARTLADEWLPRAIENGIDLGFELTAAPTRGNTVLLEELLSNLIDNALRHTPAGGTITIACGQTADSAWLAVEDSGPGLAANQRERVFERFYRTQASGEGCGLGLAIVREIACQHGGEAHAEQSATLGGASFVVNLPLAAAGLQNTPAAACPLAEASSQETGAH